MTPDATHPAQRAAAWIGTQADASGRFASGASLYGGSAGVLVFLLDLARATGAPDQARHAARVAGVLRTDAHGLEDDGLYTGRSGAAVALQLAAETLPGQVPADGGRAVLHDVLTTPHRADGCPDIISGRAGLLLTVLWFLERWPEDPVLLDHAERLGRELVAGADTTPEGPRWRLTPAADRHYPNLSHGTAGVGFALARLGRVLSVPWAAAAALEAGRTVRTLLDRNGLVHHHDGDGEDLHYLGWCHGPAGTFALWSELAVLTGDENWLAPSRTAADHVWAVLQEDQPHPGVWDNPGLCCGLAGIAWWLDDLDRHEPAAVLRAQVVAAAEPVGGGLSWQTAEHRVRPQDRTTQVGLMQGAAGIGRWLLRDHGVMRLPDQPELVVSGAARPA